MEIPKPPPDYIKKTLTVTEAYTRKEREVTIFVHPDLLNAQPDLSKMELEREYIGFQSDTQE